MIAFFFLASSGVYPTAVGMLFYLWISVFSLMVIAQFWGFANDLYTPEQGKRLFAIVGFGGSVGAVAGAFIASRLYARLDPEEMMPIAAVILSAGLLCANVIHRRDRRTR